MDKRRITWARVVMNQQMDLIMNALISRLPRVDMLEISGARWTIEGELGKFSYVNTAFPEFDICENILERKFNIIMAEQVWEHLLKPYQAGKNVYSMLEDNGYFVMNVPFLYPLHGHPGDCTRWSPLGLQSYLIECGWQQEKVWVDYWGNRECIKAHLDNDGKPIYYNPKEHSIENEPDYPVMVWAIAQK